jgi:outer membrane receptor for ferrienterochelin and colicin
MKNYTKNVEAVASANIQKTMAIALFLFFNFLLSPDSFAQLNGTISGTVMEKVDGKNAAVPFANVIIKGTANGATTDFDGKYKVTAAPGTYTLIVSYVGYLNDTIKNVVVKPGSDTKADFLIKPNAKALQEVNVISNKVTKTDAAVLMEMKQSNQIVSGVSSEQIAKSQDRDASQVMRRIPGVTVIGERFIMVRGLQERYNTVMLHNTYAPSMEADVRSFSFDILPSSLIDRMMIYKTPSAELPGDFAGGVVKIFTKSIPDENSTTVSYMSSFRDGTTFNPYFSAEKGSGSWTGFNDGRNDLPSNFPTDLRGISSANAHLLTDFGRMLPNNWTAEQSMANPDQRFAVSHSHRTKLGKIDIGNITALNYSNSKTYNRITRFDYNIYDEINDTPAPIYKFNDDRYSQNIRTGLLHNWAFRFNNKNIIELKSLFNQNASSEYVHRTGQHYEFNYFPNDHSFEDSYRGIASVQLTGKHELFDERTSFDWVAGYGRSFLNTPDYRRFRSDLDTATGESILYVPAGAAATFFLGRFYGKMDETSKTGAVNIDHKLRLFDSFVPIVSAGVFFEDKSRSFVARNIGYTRASIFNFDEGLLNTSIDSLFHPENINATTGIRIDEQTNPSDSYIANNRIFAPYVAANIPLTDKLKIKAGLRMENNLQELRSATLTNLPVNVYNPISVVLPSANLSYNLSERTILRAAYGKTLNRPEFREMAPFGFYDFNFNLVKIGNENLQTAYIHNYDVRWELYPGMNEVISVAAFYKKFINPIENFFVPGGGSGGIKTFSYGNAVDAYSAGTEVEIRKSLSGLTTSSFIEDLSVLFNASFIRSRVNLGEDLRQSNNRPLMGQSPYIVNSGLYYNNVKHELQVTLLYNIIGKRLFIIGNDEYPDIYEMPRNMLDLTVSKNFGKYTQIKVGVSDILNQEVILLQDGNNDGKWSRKNDQRIQSFRPGALYSAGVILKF